ncbi:MAG TPA: two-component regulator propeller domain-containing protein, partial [Flavitalea sp.]|nr:two-component regulator propeller domain-containing protein [Flavitalea sp.]
MNRTFFILIFFFSHYLLHAQQAKEYTFTHFTTANGLSAIQVNQILQDEKSFMWLATINGLQRYDGKRFITFRSDPTNPRSIPSDNVSLLYKDRKHNLWIGTDDNKIGIFNRASESYREIPVRWKELSVNFIGKHMFETKEGTVILVAGTYGTYAYDPETKAFLPKDDLVKSPPGWTVHSIQRDSVTDKYWLSSDSGLALFNPKTGNVNYHGKNPDKDPVIEKFGFLKSNFGFDMDGHDHYYVAAWLHGTLSWYFFNAKTNESFTSQINKELLDGRYYEINGNLFQRNGRIWVYGMPFITEFIEKGNKFKPVRSLYNNEQSIRFDNARFMYEDRQKNIWICTDNGVFVFNPDAQLFNNYGLIRPGEKSPRDGPVQVVTQLKNGNIWVGCWGLGLFCYDKDMNPIPLPRGLEHANASYSMWSICEQDSTKYVWIGMQAGGLMVYDQAHAKSWTFTHPIFEGKTIRQIEEDRQGNMWFGTHAGQIIKWDKKVAGNDPQKGYRLIVVKGTVLKMLCDQQGDLWVATAGTGLLRIDTRKNLIIDVFSSTGRERQRLWRQSPLDVIQVDDSLLLVANGAVDMLNRYTRKVVHISTEDGLPSNSVLNIQQDNDGIIWLGMTNGLCRFNFQMGIFTLYDRRDGISYDNFIVAGSNKLKDGKLVFNNDHNFMIFDPGKVVRTAVPSNPLITSVTIGGKSHLVDSLVQLPRIILPYDNNSIEFHFSALNYMQQEKMHFHYQLKGLDKQFHEAYDEASALYNYLPPGDYEFVVSSESADGISSNDVATLYLRVKPPFWKTWWFYGILILLVVAVLYLIDRERVKQMISLQQVRSNIAGNLHKEVNTTLSSISLLSEMAKIKADKDIGRAKEYIDQINDKSRKMITAMDDMLWSIEPGNDSMEKTLDRMKEYAEILHHKTGIPIDFTIDEKVRILEPGMKT